MNKIGNKIYILKTIKYKSPSGKLDGCDIRVFIFEIKKETPKYYFLQKELIDTWNFQKHEIIDKSYLKLERYKKENVEIPKIETNDDVLMKLEKTIKFLEKSDDITENEKKHYRESYKLLYNYFNKINKGLKNKK